LNDLNVRTGTAYLFTAQFVFFISAYTMHVVLGRFLGPIEYGIFGVVLYASTIVYTSVASGLPMAVARYVSAKPENAEVVFRKGLWLQLYLALPIAAAFFLLAPSIARLLGDDALAPLFRIVSPIIVFYGMFMLAVQYYNGRRQYGVQALWLILAYVLRPLLAISLAFVGFRVYGAVGGLVIAIGLAGFFAIITRKVEEGRAPFPTSTVLRFAVPLFIAAVGYAFLVDLDLMFVKKIVPGAASAGYYTSAKAIANVTPFAFGALAGALYPAVSSAYSSGDMAVLRDYVWKANRLLLQVVLPVFIVVSLNSKGILGLIYGEKYLAAAPALVWLVLAFCMLAMFIVHRSIIIGCGFPMTASVMTLILLPVCIVLQLTLTPAYGLVGAATASAITFGTAVVGSTAVIYVKFKAGFNMKSTIRIFLAAFIVFASNLGLTKLGVTLIPKLVAIGIMYLVTLRIFGELQPDQIRGLTGEFITGMRKRH
jgi:O-antigen/teichoic acid export membrane protein